MTAKDFSILDDDHYKPLCQVDTVDGVPVSEDHQPEKKEPVPEAIDITKSVAEEDKHLVSPAGVGGAVLGLVFGGPLFSALLGFGSAYAVRKKNTAGDAARALGELTISVQSKTAEIEKKNGYLEKTTKSINDYCDKDENSVAFKTKTFVVTSWQGISKYSKENQLVERGVEGTGKGLEYVGSVFGRLLKKCDKDEEEKKEGMVFISKEEAQGAALDEQTGKAL